MFENIPEQPKNNPAPITPNMPVPPQQPVNNNEINPLPQAKPKTPTFSQTVTQTDVAEEITEREQLSLVQKIILIVIAAGVILALAGGGVWLYFLLSADNTVSINNNSNKVINSNKNSVVNTNQAVNTNLNQNANVDQNLDSDNDGLTDVQEKTYGTDPLKTDTDGDGYLDGAEVSSGYNPLGSGLLK